MNTINNDNDYRRARAQLTKEAQAIALLERSLARAMDEARVRDTLAARLAFQRQLSRELETYEKRETFRYPVADRHPGTALVALRLALGLTQRGLADAFGVTTDEIIRHEKQAYASVPQPTAHRYLDILRHLARQQLKLQTLASIEAREQAAMH